MVQIGIGFFVFGFSLAKAYKEARKCLMKGPDGEAEVVDGDIDPETGRRRQPVSCPLCAMLIPASGWEDRSSEGHRAKCGRTRPGKGASGYEYILGRAEK